MKYISVNNSSLTVFISKGKLSELSGSSKYNVFDGEIVRKEKSPNGKIENRSALLDILHTFEHDNMSESVLDRLRVRYFSDWIYWYNKKFTSEKALTELELLKTVIDKAEKFGSDFVIKSEIIHKKIAEQNSRYQTPGRQKNSERKINKSKVKGKMFALFNLKCSEKFMAFYSVSFPVGTTDDQAFECWNSWLTALRKRFDLQNYVWVTERQKNGILHFHMLTNNYMPILSINRAMAIIINNKVLDGSMSWGASSLDKYNGVDVDSIWNSKRHKKTGKNLNATQIRQWITAYITKYVTKNNEKFSHLCWHCSRSISQLFTAVLHVWENRRLATDFLPAANNMYIQFKSDFNHTCVFKFVPSDNIFELLRMYNDWLFVEYEPQNSRKSLKINLKTTEL